MLLPLLSLIAALPRPCAALLEQWWSQLSPTQLQQLIAVVQQFLTVRLYHTQVSARARARDTVRARARARVRLRLRFRVRVRVGVRG